LDIKSERTADEFCHAFIASYDNIRECFPVKETWHECWRSSPSSFILARPLASNCLPSQIKKSLLTQVAQKLGLCYSACEHLRLDAIFSTGEYWFPIQVAIEHENECRGFESEIRKLFSVRCPLKVGITYTRTKRAECSGALQVIEKAIKENFDAVSAVIGEHSSAEYLFLVGAELTENEMEISTWYSLRFGASNGPGNQTFQPVEYLLQNQKGAA
jgi:hypothetical protein